MAKRALITGCSSGIGRACAIAFSNAGYEVVATARHLATIENLDVTDKIRLDVTKPDTIAAAIDRAGAVDVLVNNAGSSVWGPVEEVPISDAQDLFEVNVWGPVRVFQAVAPGMRRRGSGVVINVSSRAAHSGGLMLGFYAASKAALSRLSEAMNREVGPFGVKVSAIELAGVRSNFPLNRLVVEARNPEYARAFRTMQKSIAEGLADATSSEQVAQWILDIASEESPARRYVVSLDQKISRVE